MKFTQEWKSSGDTVTYETIEHINLDQACEAFSNFLRGCGYFFDGRVEIVENEETISSK